MHRFDDIFGATLQSISSRIAPGAPALVFGALAIASLLLQPHTVLAQQPSGATVVAGTATFATNGSTFTVTNSPNAIINWQSFNIGAGKTTRFEQQSSSSTVLNRVVEANPSVILGSLTSNGNVFLVNPNGILFGAGSRVDVGGLVASTLALSDANFLASNFRFTAVGSPGPIAVNGVIDTGNGYAALIASQISLTGALVAGSVAVGAGAPVGITLDGGRVSELTVGADLPSSSVNISSGFMLSASGGVSIGGTATFIGGTVGGASTGNILGGNVGLTLQSNGGGGLPAGGTIDNQGGIGGTVSGASGTLTVQGGNGGAASSSGGTITIGAGGSVANSGGSTTSLQNGGGGAIGLAGNVSNRPGITVAGRSASVPVNSQSTREVQAPSIVQPSIEGVRRYGPTISAPVPNITVAPLIGLAPAQVTLNLSKRESTF